MEKVLARETRVSVAIRGGVRVVVVRFIRFLRATHVMYLLWFTVNIRIKN